MSADRHTNRPGPHNVPDGYVLAAQHGDADQFIQYLTPYVDARSTKLGSKSNVDSDDFAQAIWLGLWVAVREYDETRGNYGGLSARTVSREVSTIRRDEFGLSINRTTADRVRKAVATADTAEAARALATSRGIPGSSFDRAYQAFYTNVLTLDGCDEDHI